MKYPKDSSACVINHIEHISSEIARERLNQLEKWGVQNHPSVDPVLKGINASPLMMTAHYNMPSELMAKAMCQTAEDKKELDLTWTHIAIEELSEAISAKTPKLMREELVQLAAVVESWIDSIDRNELEKN